MKNRYQGLGHVAVRTNNVEESIAFYEKIGGVVTAQDVMQTPDGGMRLVLVALGSVTVELIENLAGEALVSGAMPHVAILVDDVEAAGKEMQAAGINTFKTPAKTVSDLFGGMENWFFVGPSGEEIELMRML